MLPALALLSTLNLQAGPLRPADYQLLNPMFSSLKGHKVGLITNPTARIGDKHVIDIIAADPDIKLVALFGPEHGLRGEADAGAKVGDSTDPKTGVPIYSLYGKINRPTPEMLKGVDLLVYDIQDVGARFYTYISTMGLCMQSAAEAHIPFLVLDRPNPLGLDETEGFVLDPKYKSFVGQYPIPVQYGMTIGELAQMVKGEKWLPGLENLDLRIQSCISQETPPPGFKAPEFQTKPDDFLKPSPNLPTPETVLVYPGTCIFEGVQASEGRGTKLPFLTLGAPILDRTKFDQILAQYKIPGVKIVPHDFTPRSIPGMSSSPKFLDQPLKGIFIQIENPSQVKPVELGITLLYAFYHSVPKDDQEDFFLKGFERLAGTDRLRLMLQAGKTPTEIIDAWKPEIAAFKKAREPYLLYPRAN